MEERGLIGLEARSAGGEMLGRISEVLTDEETGETTHVVVEQDGDDGEEYLELPVSALSLDREADFAEFRADPSDEEPGEHLGDVVEPDGYAPAESDGPDDSEHENQFVTEPSDPAAAQPPDDIVKESGEAGGWQDEAFLPDSGYPRNDVYIDPNTGEVEVDPALEDNETLEDDVQDLINGTGLEVRAEKDGVVQLSGRATTQEDLDGSVGEIMGLDGVLDVDTTDVDIG
jgi:PRC-barrel domain protein